MKIYFLLILTFSLLFNSCKNSPNKNSINKVTVSYLETFDIAFELIQISDNRVNIPTVIFNEFKDPDLVWLNKIRKN